MSAPVQAHPDAEWAELETVLASRNFARSPNQVKILRYIGTKYLEGHGDSIKEYIIGVEALGRPPEFDPKQDSVVRVEAHRLREKLERYYQTEGADHPVVISLQTGHYVPQFQHRNAAGESTGSPRSALDQVQPPQNAGVHAGTEQRVDEPGLRSSGAAAHPGESAARLRLRARGVGAKRHLVLPLLLVAIGAVALIIVWESRAKQPMPPAAASPARPAEAPALVSASAGSAVRIIAGLANKDVVDESGETWGPDRYYTGGQVSVEPLVFIARASDPVLFKTAREGEFSYNIPLKPGTYEVRLYFVETEYGPGMPRGGGENSRVFSIDLNGRPLLTGLDVYSDAGGSDIADVRAFKDVKPAADGEIHLSFIRGVGDPILNALEIFPSPPGKIQPIRIITRKRSYKDAAGHLWNPDRYVKGGRLATSVNQVQDTPDPSLYSEERYGNFSYAIPVPDGRYSVTLFFAETYFGPDNLGGSGVGSRVFDVDCNGIALLRDFDILKEAGGDNRPVIRTFHDLQPNAQGKLLLSFIPVRNYACVQAIEITDESR